MFANNKGTDQPAHLRSLISAFVIHLLESIIYRLATNEIPLFLLVAVAEQTGLNLNLSETRRQVFSSPGPFNIFKVLTITITRVCLVMRKPVTSLYE